MMKNPFPYSLDNKRYKTWNYYGKTRFGKKIVKVPLDAGFTCPNRDGKLGYGGCKFCPSNGINSFPVPRSDDLVLQFENRKKLLEEKWPDSLFVPYFQSYSNTYAPVQVLREVYAPFIRDPKIPMIFIATRVDCLEKDVLNFLSETAKSKEVWVECGIQSVRDETLRAMNCGYTYETAVNTVRKLKERGFHVSVHMINGLPGETYDDMMENAKEIAKLPVDAVKFHTLLILKDAELEKIHRETPVPLLSREEYTALVSHQIGYLSPEVTVERIVSDAPKEELIAPDWVIKKTVALNGIDQYMAQEDLWQGKYYETSECN